MSNIDCVASVGAGRMGRGIALSFAFAGLPVRLIDLKPRAAGEAERLFDEARTELRADLALMQRLGLLDATQAARVEALVEYVGHEGAVAALQAPLIFEGVPGVHRQACACRRHRSLHDLDLSGHGTRRSHRRAGALSECALAEPRAPDAAGGDQPLGAHIR
jgi:hypothetical protein